MAKPIAKPIGLVIPWYGDEIRGGAEQECNYLAHSLKNAGADVEVFTTCVKDASCDRGKNTLPEGTFIESGITVRRFPVNTCRDIDSYTESNNRIYHNSDFTRRDEEIYFANDINSDVMYDYIQKHKNDYRAFLVIPYMYGITYNAASICPEKVVMIPCLHDESYAYMSVLKKRMNSLKGMIFHAKPEYDLAKRLYGLENVRTAILGEGIDTDWFSACDPKAFRQKYQIEAPFILFAGRKDAGKKADELCRFFIRLKKEEADCDLKLVLIGGGKLPVSIPDDMQSEVIDLGFVSVEDKHNAFAAAEFLCNPSYFESFSLVIMESWIAKRPVLVSEHCAVTTNFCLETNGGLYYNNYAEFRECIKYLLHHKEIGNMMGENGFQYVMEHFTHEKISRNYLKFLDEIGL